jgi:predicted lipoprotein with Yx(FWY)xxD motif
MSRPLLPTLLLLCAPLFAGAAEPTPPPAPAPASIADNGPPIRKLDGHLVDLKGRGIYTWDGDKTKGSSTCNLQCRLLWPPILAADDAQPKGPFTIVMREDGSRQWALRGRPLYRWTSDKKYGDAGGDGVSDVWHLVKVAPTVSPTPTTTSQEEGKSK